LAAVVLVVTSGCSTAAAVRTDDSPGLQLAPTAPAAVRVFFTPDAGTPYDVLGVVFAAADAGDDPSVPIELLRQQAAGLGADGVVDARLEFTRGQWRVGIAVSGVAVRLRRGSP
jgi:hypothetical protein